MFVDIFYTNVSTKDIVLKFLSFKKQINCGKVEYKTDSTKIKVDFTRQTVGNQALYCVHGIDYSNYSQLLTVLTSIIPASLRHRLLYVLHWWKPVIRLSSM